VKRGLKLFILLLLVSTGCGRAPSGTTARVPSVPPRPAAPLVSSEPRYPPVVVTIIVDQLAAWVAAERLPLLPESGGFRRLMREGTTIREARLPYSVTDTAPGHAAAYTGAPPRASGVTANERVDPATRERVSAFRDAATRLVGLQGPMAAIGSSPAFLGAPTLADELREQDTEAVVISLSIKDRSAIAGGGRHPTVRASG
jgi:hypothetical protein